MVELSEQAQPMFCSVTLDILHQRAEQLLDIYNSHIDALFPLSAIFSSIITASNTIQLSASLWNKQSQVIIISSYYGLVRVLNEVANYLEQMGVCAHLDPLDFPFIEDIPSIMNKYHQIALTLGAPCFLYDSIYLSCTSNTPYPTPIEPFYKRVLSHIRSYLYPVRSYLQRNIISTYKRQCLELILSKIISATSSYGAPYHILVILATVSASSLSAKSTIFLWSQSIQQPNHSSALLIIPAPVSRREAIAPNSQVIKVAGYLPPINFKKHDETLTFTDLKHSRSGFRFFRRKLVSSWHVVSPSHTGVLLPFTQKCGDISSWSSIAKNTRIYGAPMVKTSRINTLRINASRRKRLKQHKVYRNPFFSFKQASKPISTLSSQRRVNYEATRSRNIFNANSGNFFCCHMSPGEYDAQLPFQTRIPLALSQCSKPLLRVKKQFTPGLSLSSSGQRVYTFTVQLRLPDDLDSSLSIYISKVSLHFSGACGAVLAHDSSEPLSIPCTCELPVGKFIANKDGCTEYGLYSLHTQRIEWQPSSVKRYNGNTTSCVSLKAQYCSNDVAEAPIYPVVDVFIDSNVIPDVVYVTNIVP